jgi:hypothetical protein
LGHRDVLSLPTIDARYERLSGGPGKRAVLYVARRKLGLSPDEWEALPWWTQRLYIDGLLNEGMLEMGEQPENDPDPVSASDAELRGLGLTVIDGGRV